MSLGKSLVTITKAVQLTRNVNNSDSGGYAGALLWSAEWRSG